MSDATSSSSAVDIRIPDKIAAPIVSAKASAAQKVFHAAFRRLRAKILLGV
jgi:hypothetical protein